MICAVEASDSSGLSTGCGSASQLGQRDTFRGAPRCVDLDVPLICSHLHDRGSVRASAAGRSAMRRCTTARCSRAGGSGQHRRQRLGRQRLPVAGPGGAAAGRWLAQSYPPQAAEGQAIVGPGAQAANRGRSTVRARVCAEEGNGPDARTNDRRGPRPVRDRHDEPGAQPAALVCLQANRQPVMGY